MQHLERIDQQVRECIDACQECATICLETMNHCLIVGGKHAEAKHITLMADCAEICRTAANSMARGSTFQQQLCAICSQICRSCASDCDRFGDDQAMKQCADVCRRCADICERMSGGGSRRAGG